MEVGLRFRAALFCPGAHGFPVRSQSGPTWPRSGKAWIEAADHALGEGPQIEIRVELGPLGEALQVDLRMTAHP